MKKELEESGSVEEKQISGLEKAREKLIEKKQLENEVKLELMKELGKEVKDVSKNEKMTQ